MDFQEMIESLYNLSGDELRALAWEALLISDGPDAVHKPSENSQFDVECVDDFFVDPISERAGFTVVGKTGWQTATNTMPDTPIK